MVADFSFSLPIPLPLALLGLLLPPFVYFVVQYGYLMLFFWNFIKLKSAASRFMKKRGTTADWFESRAKKTPDRIAVLFEGRTVTFRELDEMANEVAWWSLKECGLKRGDVVSLMMENRIEFISTWLGLTKIGVAIALINTNLRLSPLAHSISICDPKSIIVGSECLEAVVEILKDLKPGVKLYSSGPSTRKEFQDMKAQLDSLFPSSSSSSSSVSPSQVDAILSARAGASYSDVIFFILTSGTTGLPKAAKIKHIRFFLTGSVFSTFFKVGPSDRIYNPLPMYHSAGGMIGVGVCFQTGACLVLRKKFSASTFFKDCYENKVTVVQYIGQLCRYLVATPPGPYDQKHSVRMALGNGLQADIWQQFQTRFRIPEIAEFYSSTEGNSTLINTRNKVGAVGYIPPIAQFIYPVRFVKFDHLEQAPFRNAKGFCEETATNEPGELIALIKPNDPISAFEGYTNSKSTSDKILRNVFKTGDAYFRSGDLIRRDAEGYCYFVDRIGDTFRWKGENVATSEVEAIMNGYGHGFKEINVYGVTVGKNDGRAGMASVCLSREGGPHGGSGESEEVNVEQLVNQVNWKSLYSYLKSQLSSYQQPLFIRCQHEIAITTTFKHRKVDMVREGFNPFVIKDPIVFKDDEKQTFVRLDEQLYHKIMNGEVRV